MRQSQKIRNNFNIYSDLVYQPKIATSNPLLINENINNVKWLAGQVSLKRSSGETLQLIAEQRKASRTDYKFKIRCIDFCDEPLLRFDSDGVAHRNDLDHIPLPERQVTTPHFHIFNQQGIEMAYKTEFLSSPRRCEKVKSDINLGLKQFAIEGKIRASRNAFPKVEDRVANLPSTETEFDPSAGTTF